MTSKLIYVYDPLCGWCFGFIGALEYVRDALPDLPIDLRLGGLVVGERVSPYANLMDFVRANAPAMQAKTGARIGEAFFEKMLPSQTLMSSQPPNAAILAVREAAPDRTVDFTHAVQKAYFHDAADLNDAHLYPRLAEELGLEGIAFDIPGPNDTPAHLAQEYDATRSLNFQGFPSLFLQTDDQPPRPLTLSYDGQSLLRSINGSHLPGAVA